MNTRRGARGFSLIEVFAALAVLGIAMLGLTAGLVVAGSTTAISAQRTLMLQFAQTRIERLVAETRTKIPTSNFTVQGSLCCAKMAAGGMFRPNSAPGTGGWQMDTIDGPPGALAGDDIMFGPVLRYDATANATETYVAQTIAARNAAFSAGVDGNLGCGDASVRIPGMLCREIHVEPANYGGVAMLSIWVRVVSGSGSYLSNSVMLQEDVAQ